jgi:hypothetical protein
MTTHSLPRRVLLLETDERAGLVAGLAAACAARNVSLEIVTGPGHVLISVAADDSTLEALLPDLRTIPGVVNIQPYTVA